MYHNLQLKQTRFINARKELREQNRIRVNFEKSMQRKLIIMFNEFGNKGANIYESTGTTGLTLYFSKTRNKVEQTLKPFYIRIIQTFSERLERRLTKKEGNFFDILTERYMTSVGANHISDIDTTTRKQLQRVISQAQKEGLGVAQTARQIEERFQPRFTRARSATIARTETHSAASFANHEMGKELQSSGVQLKKQWVATSDERTRIAHVTANGTTVPMDEAFVVDGASMQYTGDPNGGARNVINCRCVTLYIEEETTVYDTDIAQTARTVVPKPLPNVTPEVVNIEKLLSSPANASLTYPTLILKSKRQVQKELDDRTIKVIPEYTDIDRAIADDFDDYYRSYGSRFRGGQRVNTNGLRGMEDDTASIVLEVTKELDELADRFKIPKLNGFVSGTKKGVGASMGDGNMFINYKVFNEYARNSKGRKFNKNPDDIAKENQLAKEIKELSDNQDALIEEGKRRFNAIRTQFALPRLLDADGKPLPLYPEGYNEWVIRYKNNKSLKTKKRNELDKLFKKTDAPDIKPISTWKRGDETIKRPFGSDEYFDDGIDKIRSTMYHEFGHHVHQITDVKNLKDYLDPILEQRLRKLKGVNGRDVNYGIRGAPTKYGDKNTKEWFTENFALYFLNKKELTDPLFIDLIEDILKKANNVN
tara:strand:- start:17528 stop:19483 length:1956 start_codon:yes stop_codon:yes gene_type:complete